MRAKRATQTERRHFTRKLDEREPYQRFLIVCEGKRTEPNYFESFRKGLGVNASVKIVGAGDNTYRVVERAIELKEHSDYDQVWCVFDHDSFPAAHFNRAFELARTNNINIAYSNEAFELWYLLHFDYVNTGISRDTYKRRLTERIGRPYKKNGDSIYAALEAHQEAAINNARRLHHTYDPPNPERDNPSTTVYLLVEELRRHMR